MQILRYGHCRPAIVLGVAVALAATLACGAAGEPDPGAAPQPTDVSDHAHQSQSDQETQIQNPTNQQNPTSEVVINLPVADRKTTLTRQDLRVSQGDTVRLIFEADEEGEIHLHGYDLTAPVSPGHPGELVFEAATAGAFALNFHVFGHGEEASAADHHGSATPEIVVSETPLSVHITAEADGHAGVNVSIIPEGLRFAPELVDQPHTDGAGHAHIYVDGVKLGRVFENEYHIENLPPGEHEIRVSLNSNNHRELTYDGKKVEDTAIVTVPDVGQGHDGGKSQESSDGHGHSHDHDRSASDGREVVAEVHLGNLEVYP